MDMVENPSVATFKKKLWQALRSSFLGSNALIFNFEGKKD